MPRLWRGIFDCQAGRSTQEDYQDQAYQEEGHQSQARDQGQGQARSEQDCLTEEQQQRQNDAEVREKMTLRPITDFSKNLNKVVECRFWNSVLLVTLVYYPFDLCRTHGHIDILHSLTRLSQPTSCIRATLL